MLVSPQFVDDQRPVVIHVDDYNASDHYAISTSMTLPSAHVRNDTSTKCKTLKYLWDNADIHWICKRAEGTIIESSSSKRGINV